MLTDWLVWFGCNLGQSFSVNPWTAESSFTQTGPFLSDPGLLVRSMCLVCLVTDWLTLLDHFGTLTGLPCLAIFGPKWTIFGHPQSWTVDPKVKKGSSPGLLCVAYLWNPITSRLEHKYGRNRWKMSKAGQNSMTKWPFFAIILPWMASYGSEISCLLVFSARDDLVKVSWKSDAQKCQNQVTPLTLTSWVKVPSPFYMWKKLVPFTQLVKVRRGKLVLALPSIRFSWNFYQIISGTKYE